MAVLPAAFIPFSTLPPSLVPSTSMRYQRPALSYASPVPRLRPTPTLFQHQPDSLDDANLTAANLAKAAGWALCLIAWEETRKAGRTMDANMLLL